MYVDVPGMTARVRVPEPDEIPQMSDDGYPDVISDQRHGYGKETRQEIEDYWLDYLDAHHIEPWTDDTLSAVPYINRARWLVDCPSCNAGNWAWDRNPLVCCLECGLICKAAWLAPQVRSQAIRLLAVRPIANCNWNCHKGETVQELEVENRWLLNDPGIKRNGLWLPESLTVPDELEVG